jgi:HEAT repeat protein
LRQIAPTEPDSKATVAALAAVLKDESPKVRRAAGMALRVIDLEAAKKAGVR